MLPILSSFSLGSMRVAGGPAQVRQPALAMATASAVVSNTAACSSRTAQICARSIALLASSSPTSPIARNLSLSLAVCSADIVLPYRVTCVVTKLVTGHTASNEQVMEQVMHYLLFGEKSK